MKVKLDYERKTPTKKTVLEDNNSFPAITKQCSQCQKGKVIVKWNKPKKKYSENK